jgi:hypothetical protein
VSRSSVNQALHSKGAILNAITLAHRDTVKAPKTNIFYMVTTAAPKELRAAKRCRTHLRSGKILNAGNRKWLIAKFSIGRKQAVACGFLPIYVFH